MSEGIKSPGHYSSYAEDTDDRPMARGEGRRTIRHALEEQGMLLGELEKSYAVLRDHLSPMLREDENKPMSDDESEPGGNSRLHDDVRKHNELIQRLIRRVDSLNREVDI